MGRTIRNRNNTPNVAPVEKIELSEKNLKLRIILVVLFLAIGASAIAYGVHSWLSEDTGWKTIEVDSGAATNCGNDFVLMYNLGASGASATAENKAIMKLYTDAAVKAYQLFHSNEAFEYVNNIYYINRHPNEEIVVDPVLYQAFSLLKSYDNRNIYLAPIYLHYDDMFYCQDDALTVDFDPYQNEEVAEEYKMIATFAKDEKAVDIQLLGDNRVRLFVSDEYLEYAQANFITDYIDFFWMKNAFIVDYLADTLRINGFISGSISSFDGFARNLDESDMQYSFNILDKQDKDIYVAGTMEYSGSMSIVYLRNYMVNTQDIRHYYEFDNGDTRTSYLDVKDGRSKSAVNNLVSYSKKAGCAEVLLQMIPVYIAETFSEEAVADLVDQDIYTIYCQDSVIYYNEDSLQLTDLYDKAPVGYTSTLVQ